MLSGTIDNGYFWRDPSASGASRTWAMPPIHTAHPQQGACLFLSETTSPQESHAASTVPGRFAFARQFFGGTSLKVASHHFPHEETSAMDKAVDVAYLDFILPLTQSPIVSCPGFGLDRVNFHRKLGGGTARKADLN